MTTFSKPSLPAGAAIKGKWNHGEYVMVRMLGEGANGRVYLVQKEKRLYALKIGCDSLDLQSEVNVLQKLALSESKKPPFLIDVDDFCIQGNIYPFYVMRYVRGQSLPDFVESRGCDWLYVLGYSLLRKLCHLHSQGWIFGDLKAENVIVPSYGEAELVDYGGVTPIGRSVKQFTELYDRGYWGAGSRIAEPAYDLFAFAILMLHIMDPQKRVFATLKFSSPLRNVRYLMEIIRTTPQGKLVAPFLQKALQGKYSSSEEAAMEWRECILRTGAGRRDLGPLQLPLLKGFFTAALCLFAATLFLVLK